MLHLSHQKAMELCFHIQTDKLVYQAFITQMRAFVRGSNVDTPMETFKEKAEELILNLIPEFATVAICEGIIDVRNGAHDIICQIFKK